MREHSWAHTSCIGACRVEEVWKHILHTSVVRLIRVCVCERERVIVVAVVVVVYDGLSPTPKFGVPEEGGCWGRGEERGGWWWERGGVWFFFFFVMMGDRDRVRKDSIIFIIFPIDQGNVFFITKSEDY